jgi:hypothetical protein
MKPSGSTRLTVSSVAFARRSKVLRLRSVWQGGSISIRPPAGPPPGGGVGLAGRGHPPAGRCLDLVVRHRLSGASRRAGTLPSAIPGLLLPNGLWCLPQVSQGSRIFRAPSVTAGLNSYPHGSRFGPSCQAAFLMRGCPPEGIRYTNRHPGRVGHRLSAGLIKIHDNPDELHPHTWVAATFIVNPLGIVSFLARIACAFEPGIR